MVEDVVITQRTYIRFYPIAIFIFVLCNAFIIKVCSKYFESEHRSFGGGKNWILSWKY